MYFDEVYHARTAYEHISGISPYENSHPPLGKIFIMLGVAIFGMNPFGWRIIGTLFGIAMIPLMYCFALRLFKKREYAFFAAALFAFDFMHFAQTRIGTIDVYGVFFVIAMLYYMYKFYITNYNVQPLKTVLLPLGTAGVMFGLGSASKWICIYTGAGLAVMFFVYLAKRIKEYRYACDNADICDDVDHDRRIRFDRRDDALSGIYDDRYGIQIQLAESDHRRGLRWNCSAAVASFRLLPSGIRVLLYQWYDGCFHGSEQSPQKISGQLPDEGRHPLRSCAEPCVPQGSR